MAFRLPDLRGVVGKTVRQPGQELRTAYFDTSDFRVWQRGMSLRHRMGSRRAPVSGLSRCRRHAARPTTTDPHWTEPSSPGPEAGTPCRCRRRISYRGIVCRGILEQVTELVTSRLRFVLHDAEGRSCAELDDDTVTVVGGRRHGLRFRQLEVELGDGGAAILDAVLRELRRAGAHVGDAPKLAKALGLRTGSGGGSSSDPAAKGHSEMSSGPASTTPWSSSWTTTISYGPIRPGLLRIRSIRRASPPGVCGRI